MPREQLVHKIYDNLHFSQETLLQLDYIFFLDDEHAFFIPDVYVIGLCALKSSVFLLIPWLRIH